MKITFLGHSGFIIEGSKALVLDPFVSPNPEASEIIVEDIKTDYVLLSHGHEDHVADAETILKKNDAMVISNFEIVSWYEEKGVEKGHPLNHGGKVNLDFGFVKFVNAVHSSVLPDGTYGGNPGGFIIEMDGKKFYYSGDTALHVDMELIGRLEKPEFAMLCIGDNFTMGVADAIEAAKMTNVKKVIGMHFNTFPYIKTDVESAKTAFNKEGIELITLEIGESIEV